MLITQNQGAVIRLSWRRESSRANSFEMQCISISGPFCSFLLILSPRNEHINLCRPRQIFGLVPLESSLPEISQSHNRPQLYLFTRLLCSFHYLVHTQVHFSSQGMRQIWYLNGPVWIATLFVCHPLVHLCQHFNQVVGMTKCFYDLDQDLFNKKSKQSTQSQRFIRSSFLTAANVG